MLGTTINNTAGVSHNQIKELQFYCVRGILLEWFKSYTYNRKQKVELKFLGPCNYSSSWKTVKSGVLQRLVLEPRLFNIYINDFSASMDNDSNMIMYAKDTCF
jgi:hypothetical protein